VTSVAASGCPRCGTTLARGQEYCLECGVRVPGPGRFGGAPTEPGRLLLPLAVLGLVAALGAGVAIWATGDPAPPLTVVTATGGNVAVSTPKEASEPEPAGWPADTEGWTVVLLSVPKVRGKAVALQATRDARSKGLRGVGIIDSSRFPSLQPGYWMVFAGRYPNEAEATSHLQAARKASKSSRVQRIAG
jgi:hypothetical protein